MAGGKNLCLECGKIVAKGAKALGCGQCGKWLHVGCGVLEEGDLVFMSGRSKAGFRWFCDRCTLKPDHLKFDILDSVKSMLSEFHEEILNRMKTLESNIQSTKTVSKDPLPKAFAEVVKEAVKQSKHDLGQNENVGIKMSASVNNKVIQSKEVLVVKPKRGSSVGPAELAAVSRDIDGALRCVPVESCKETKSGAVVMKFPSKEAKNDASTAISNCLGEESQYTVSEPKKLLPKITLVGLPKSFPDCDIIDGIVNKNVKVKELKNEGYTLELIFTKTKGDFKHAVIRVSPEIRASIQKDDWFVFVGLNKCKVYDRFWVTQCYHCQNFGHIDAKCPTKSQSATCGFCAGNHNSRNCTQKSTPCCANCSRMTPQPQSLAHFASSQNCPILVSQRQRLIENTEFSSSKNFL